MSQYYTTADADRLRQHYSTLRDKASYDHFIASVRKVTNDHQISPEIVRMALTGKYSMMELGSRAAVQHRETADGIEVGVIMLRADVETLGRDRFEEVQDFRPDPMHFVKFIAPSWSEVDPAIWAAHSRAVADEHSRQRGKKLVGIRKGSGTDSNSLHYAIFNAVSIQDLPPGTLQPQTLPDKDLKTDTMTVRSLNTILFGPPGTGKTYQTIGAAVEICDPVYYATNKDSDDALRSRYNELLIKEWDDADWQIAFCTFHQSFSYEDFVEGIKPVLPEDDEESALQYEMRDGILKMIARRAEVKSAVGPVTPDEQINLTEEEYNKNFFKLSLGAKYNREDADIYRDCIRNNVIAIGYLDQHDLTGKTDREINQLALRPDQKSSSASQMNYFCNQLKIGDYVIITHGNRSVRAIGRVTGGYNYSPEREIRYPHIREVEWLVKDAEIPYEALNKKQFVMRTIYKLDKEDLKKEFFVRGTRTVMANARKNYVLIIDEINRGNVSGIFGELITLIEENKRKGRAEELEVMLPYSQESFGIPDNLYIIGTMNTADRSVEALDSALRRRFSFVECPSRPSELEKLPYRNVAGIDLVELLGVINARIEMLLDRDHHIGHSYFMNWSGNDTEMELRRVFRNNILPLLQEYFYGDPVKIGLVLGEGFVQVNSDKVKLARFSGADDVEAKTRYSLLDPLAKNAVAQYVVPLDAFRQIIGT